MLMVGQRGVEVVVVDMWWAETEGFIGSH